ncbi:hypothetical protein ACWDSD_40980 [Streptomyces spiralis]
MTIDDVLHGLGVDPADLTPALARHVHRDAATRIGRSPCPCAGCGGPARATGIIDVPGYGRRWLDRCRDCLVATIDLEPSRVPGTVDGIVADLCAAAVEAGVQLTVVIEEEGDCRGYVPPVPPDHDVGRPPGAAGLVGERGDRPPQVASWVGEYGSMPGARITLTDEESGQTVTAWPDALTHAP